MNLWKGIVDWWRSPTEFSSGSSAEISSGDSGIEQRSNAAVHPFLRGLESSFVAGERLVKPFAHSVWVQRAIKRVAEPIAAVALEFFEGDTEIKDANLSAFWETPGIDRSGLMSKADFIEASIGWLKLQGESFWILDDTWLTNRFSGQRMPLIVARPDRMKPILEHNVALMGWQWTDAAGNTHPLLKEQVVHLKFWNPYDDLRGLAEWEAARVAGESDYLAGKFQLNMNRANGDRGVIVVAKNGIPTDVQQEQITRALREKANACRRGDFRPIFLSGDVAIENPEIQSPDADFVTGRLQNRHEVFIAFGVPPSMADLVANYSVGQASDRYVLISETCIPLANGKLCGGINRVSQMFFPGGRPALISRFKFDDHPVMQQVRRERIDTGTKLWDRGMPWDRISEHLDLGLPEFEGSDKGYVPFSVAEVGEGEDLGSKKEDSGSGKTEEQEQEQEENGKIDAMLAALRATPEERMRVALTAPLQLTSRAGDSKREALWKSHMRQQAGTVKMFGAKFNKVLMSARSECLGKIEHHYKAERGTRNAELKAVAADLVFSLDPFKSRLTATMRGAGQQALKTAGDQANRELGNDDPWSMAPEAMKRILDGRENLMKDVADEVFDTVKGTLKEGIDAGDSTADLASRVKEKFNDISKGRSTVVAKTETAVMYGAARHESMKQAGIQYKEWLTAHDDRVRDAHMEADGQIVGIDEPFNVGGEELAHPGDPDGSPENVINCRCVQIASTAKSGGKEEED